MDFETYYDDEYTLKKLSTSEYVRDPRFEVVSVAVKVGDGPTKVAFGMDGAKKLLAKVDWPKVDLLCHHAHFDGLILSHHFGHVPNKYRCTLSMARALDERTERNDLGTIAARYGVVNKLVMPDFKGKHAKDLTAEEKRDIEAYNARDVDCTAEIYEMMLERMPERELEVVHLTVQMFADPLLLLDVNLAKKELGREKRRRSAEIRAARALELLEQFEVEPPKVKKGEKLTAEKVLSSNKAFPELLRGFGIDPPMKISKYNGKETYALSKADEEFTDLLAHPNDGVAALVRGRLAAKSTIGESRPARLLRSGEGGQRLPVYLNYCGAHTTRWSGGDKLNYQNLPKKGDIRRSILAPKGQVLVVIDSSQIEARVVAWLAGETWVTEAFRDKRDLYCEFATKAFGFPVTKKDNPVERFVGKTCTLGLGFQMGAPKLQWTLMAQSMIQRGEPLRMDLETCYRLVNTYRNQCQKIVALWKFMQNDVILSLASTNARRTYKCIEYWKGHIRLPNGLELKYPGARASVERRSANPMFKSSEEEVRVEEASYETLRGRTKLYGGMLTENVVQALARCVVADQMVEISDAGYRPVMMTHDEVVYLAPENSAEKALKFGLDVMHTPPSWAPDLPVAAEGGFDHCYSK